VCAFECVCVDVCVCVCVCVCICVYLCVCVGATANIKSMRHQRKRINPPNHCTDTVNRRVEHICAI